MGRLLTWGGLGTLGLVVVVVTAIAVDELVTGDEGSGGSMITVAAVTSLVAPPAPTPSPADLDDESSERAHIAPAGELE